MPKRYGGADDTNLIVPMGLYRGDCRQRRLAWHCPWRGSGLQYRRAGGLVGGVVAIGLAGGGVAVRCGWTDLRAGLVLFGGATCTE